MTSKAAATAARERNEPIGKLLLINAHMFMRVTVGCSNTRPTECGVAAVASEPVHALAMCGNDATVAMQLLATSSGISGLVQWLVNPTFGKLSDRYGRRPFFLIGPAWNTVGNFLIAMNPHNKVLFATLRVVGKTLQTLSGSTTSMAALSDCASGDRLTFWSAWLGSAACVGVIIGGWIETVILALRGQGATQTVYFTMAAMGAVHTAMVALLLPETLPTSERKTDPPRFQSPLGMFKLFANGRSLRLAALSCSFACFADGANLNDIDQMWIKEDVDDMGLAANSVYLTAWGLAGSFSGLIVPGLLSALGSRGFTTLTNATNFLACMVWGGIPLGPRMWAIFCGLLLHTPGIDGNANLCVKSEATDLAIETGMGRGEFAGYYGSMRALTVAIGPYIFGNLYAWGRRAFTGATGRPRYNLGFFAAALLGCVVPEVFHQLLRRSRSTKVAS